MAVRVLVFHKSLFILSIVTSPIFLQSGEFEAVPHCFNFEFSAVTSAHLSCF